MAIKKIITAGKKNTLNIFSHYTNSTKSLSEFIQYSKARKQKNAIICHGNNFKELSNLDPDFLIFPLFSLNKETHNEYSGSDSFYTIISAINHLPQKTQKIVMFFINKDNFSECTELDSFAYSQKLKIWIIPLQIFSDKDFNNEDISYLKRLRAYKTLHINPLDLYILKHNLKQTGNCHLLSSNLNADSLLLKFQVKRFYQRLFR
ncbi:MAG: hypothetical protein PHV30_03230 [Candidatus Margulisbacteria bacterium]|nr:hypothetical protein [Candidatus Margulisiibacteriota bacterium]